MFPTDFLPNGPYTWTLAAMLGVAIAGTLISSERRFLWPISAVMAANWLFVQAASDIGSIGLAATGAACSAILLAIWRDEISVALAVLFVPRLVIYASNPFFGINETIMWELNNLIVIVQITILAGGSINGTRLLLARSFDFFAGLFRKLGAVPYFWRNICEALGPIHRINREAIQKRRMTHEH